MVLLDYFVKLILVLVFETENGGQEKDVESENKADKHLKPGLRHANFAEFRYCMRQDDESYCFMCCSS